MTSHLRRTSSLEGRRHRLRHFRLALERARAIYNHSESVLGFGIGFKRSRDKARRGLPAISFTVVRKSITPPKGERIPKRIRVEDGTGVSHVFTDVLSSRVWYQHSSRCYLAVQPENFGVASFLATDGEGRRLLVTAGHVFALGGTAVPPRPVPAVGDPGAVAAGDVAPRLTYTTWPMASSKKGMFIDVGVSTLTEDQFASMVTLLRDTGRPQIRSVVERDRFVDGVVARKPPTYTVYGQGNPFQATFKGVTLAGQTMQVVAGGVVTRTYAPMLIESDAKRGTFRPCDSGAPLIDEDGGLWGVHILGDRGGGHLGCALAASSIIEFLGEMLNTAVRVV